MKPRRRLGGEPMSSRQTVPQGARTAVRNTEVTL